jgi:hypothetical protein
MKYNSLVRVSCTAGLTAFGPSRLSQKPSQSRFFFITSNLNLAFGSAPIKMPEKVMLKGLQEYQ